MKEFEAVIGIEIHVQLKTKSKMFSGAPVSFAHTPNTHVAINDMAFPGSMPSVNKQAVVYAIRVCSALHMSIDNLLVFDRKNYFYSDLPKGYQITQHFKPIGKNGYLTLNNGKTIGIERLHIEEDTCKQIHENDYSLIDYNRAGIPLLEIVSLPVISNGLEAQKFVEQIRSIVTFLNVSDGKMENGSLRCDVNVSIREKGSKVFGTKVEIKNLNSISYIQKAIDYEIERQISLLSEGKTIRQETRRFDDVKKQTVLMRVKEDDVDYKYFVDPNIVPIRLSDEFINEVINSSPELADSKHQRFLDLGLNETVINVLLSDKKLCDYFEEALKEGVNPKLLANWVIVEIQFYLNKNNISIDEFSISPKNLAELISLIDKSLISNKQARIIFDKMINGGSAKELLKELGLNQISDVNEINLIIDQVLNDNPKAIEDYLNGKSRALSYLLGLILKESKGRANPSLTNKLLTKKLEEKRR